MVRPFASTASDDAGADRVRSGVPSRSAVVTAPRTLFYIHLHNASEVFCTCPVAAHEQVFRRRSVCPLNASLEMLGDRWSLLILRDMMIWSFKIYKAALPLFQLDPRSIGRVVGLSQAITAALITELKTRVILCQNVEHGPNGTCELADCGNRF